MNLAIYLISGGLHLWSRAARLIIVYVSNQGTYLSLNQQTASPSFTVGRTGKERKGLSVPDQRSSAMMSRQRHCSVACPMENE